MSTIDPATTKYFEDYLDLFVQPGWQKFMQDLQASLTADQTTAVARCTTDQLWFEERGAQAKTLKLLNFENMIRNSYDSLQADEETTDPLDED